MAETSQRSESPQDRPAVAATSVAGSRPRRPWVTWLAIALCIVVFLGIFQERAPYSWSALSKWGARPSGDIWQGAYWALVSSVFVHLEVWHLAFNVYWLWVLGSRLERTMGSGRYLIFFLLAAVVSSGAELAASDQTGIGASGVGYAIFGFMWVARNRFPEFREILSPRLVLQR